MTPCRNLLELYCFRLQISEHWRFGTILLQ
jgi:hypothetical protein